MWEAKYLPAAGIHSILSGQEAAPGRAPKLPTGHLCCTVGGAQRFETSRSRERLSNTGGCSAFMFAAGSGSQSAVTCKRDQAET